MKERLQKLMARANVGSRRACEELIAQKRVTLNNKIAEIGDQADPNEDIIKVDGVRIKPEDFIPRFFALNKPRNVLSTNDAPPGDERQTVRDLIPVEGHLFTIGRLDADSEGLIVLTNDGETANKLAHPRYEHTKTYEVWVYGHPGAEILERWMDGVWLDDERTAPCYVQVMETTPQQTLLRVIMLEGRKRQIRRIATLLGFPVARLIRTHVGKLGLGTLRRGEWVRLLDEDVEAMLTPADEVRFMRRRKRVPRPAVRMPDAESPFSQLKARYALNPVPRLRPRRLPAAADMRRKEGEERPDNPYAPRPRRSSSDRPNRPYGDRPPRRDGEGRPSSGDRPKRPYGDRPPRRDGDARSGDRPKRPFGDRPPRRDGDARSGDRPNRPFGDRPPRRDGDARSGDRPNRPYGDRPPRKDGEGRPSSGDRPNRPYGDRPPRRDDDARPGDRPSRPYGDRPPRKDGEGRPSSSNRPNRPAGDRPARPRREDDDIE